MSLIHTSLFISPHRREAAKVPVSISCTSTTGFLEAPSGVKCINNDLTADRAPSYQEATAVTYQEAITPYIEQTAPPYSEAKFAPYTEGKAPPYSVNKSMCNEHTAPVNTVLEVAPHSEDKHNQHQHTKDKVVHLEDYGGAAYIEDRSPYIDINVRTGEEQLYC